MKRKWMKIGARSQRILQQESLADLHYTGVEVNGVYWRGRPTLGVRYNTPLTYNYVDTLFEPQLDSNIEEFIAKKNSEIEDVTNLLIEELERDLKTVPVSSKKELSNLHDRFLRSMSVMMCGRAYVEAISKKIADQIGNEEWKKFEHLVHPHKRTMLVREHEAMVKLHDTLHSGCKEEANKLAQKIAKEFGFIHSEYVSKSWESRDYVDHAKHISSSQEMPVTGAQHEDGLVRWLIELMQKFVYIYDEEKSTAVRINWAFRESLKKMDEDDDVILNLTKVELNKWIDGRLRLDWDQIKDRSKYFAIVPQEESPMYITGKENVQEVIDQFTLTDFSQQKLDTDTIKGSCGNKGCAKGRVRVVHTQEDAKALQAGEILVASMTTPALIGAMSKAVAFVTDEGGILSHAAIVAREMQKPCVVGTGNGTQVLQNGTMVSVKADQGIIKIEE